MAEHVRVRSVDAHASLLGQAPQSPCRGVPVHPGTPAVEQDGPARPVPDGLVDSAADRRRQRDEHDLGALAAHPEHPVTVFLPEVADVSAGGLEDPEAEQAEHSHQHEIMPVRGLAGGREHGLELQVGEAERGRLGGHGRPADMLGW